jgi:hypothetical protein
MQIAALSGANRSTAGLASGLVETMREIGGGVGVAAVTHRAGLSKPGDGRRAAIAGVRSCSTGSMQASS